MLSSSHRTLVRAIVVSMLVHAAALLSVVSLLPVRADAPATSIRMVMNPATPKVVPKPESVAPAKVSSEVKKTAAPVRQNNVEKPLSVPDSPTFSAPEWHPPAAQPVAREATSSGQAVKAAPGDGGSAAAPAPPRDGLNGEDVRQYKISVSSAAKRFKVYPRLARERGWEGTAEIAIDTSSLSAAPEIVLLHSSGKKLLDEQALEMVSRAVRAASLPDGLKGQAFRVVLPVQFSLDDE